MRDWRTRALRHASIAAGYLAVSAALGFGLAWLVPGLSEVVPGWALALLLLVPAAGTHAARAGRERERRMARQLEVMAREVAANRVEVDGLREELAHLRDEVDEFPDPDAIVAELKVLQGLLEQLPGKGRPDAAAAARRAAAPVPVATEARDVAMVVDSDDELLDILERALREDRVELYLQPIVSLPQRKRLYYECFSRVRGEDGRVVTPERYIRVAEQAGLVSTIDNMLLFKCVQMVRRARKDHINVGFFYNISSASLTDIDFFTDFIDFMAANRHLAESLMFEFDQATVADAAYEVEVNLQRLADIGYRFSVDQVRDLALDLPRLAAQGFKFVKVEAHLLHEMARGDDPRLDMRAFKAALDRCAMDLIVEKIETDDMLKDLLDLRIDFGQGYLFGEPRRGVETD